MTQHKGKKSLVSVLDPQIGYFSHQKAKESKQKKREKKTKSCTYSLLNQTRHKWFKNRYNIILLNCLNLSYFFGPIFTFLKSKKTLHRSHGFNNSNPQHNPEYPNFNNDLKPVSEIPSELIRHPSQALRCIALLTLRFMLCFLQTIQLNP